MVLVEESSLGYFIGGTRVISSNYVVDFRCFKKIEKYLERPVITQ